MGATTDGLSEGKSNAAEIAIEDPSAYKRSIEVAPSDTRLFVALVSSGILCRYSFGWAGHGWFSSRKGRGHKHS